MQKLLLIFLFLGSPLIARDSDSENAPQNKKIKFDEDFDGQEALQLPPAVQPSAARQMRKNEKC